MLYLVIFEKGYVLLKEKMYWYKGCTFHLRALQKYKKNKLKIKIKNGMLEIKKNCVCGGRVFLDIIF